jgi:hypothetical protein
MATVVTQDERVYAYLPWYAYMPAAVFTGMKGVTAEDLVTAAKEGKIDAFILVADLPDGRWRWGTIGFKPELFDASSFDVVRLENNFVLVIRKP